MASVPTPRMGGREWREGEKVEEKEQEIEIRRNIGWRAVSEAARLIEGYRLGRCGLFYWDGAAPKRLRFGKKGRQKGRKNGEEK